MRADSTLRVFVFANPGGKLVNIQRVKLYDSVKSTSLMDGKLVIVAGPVTMIVDAPDE